MLKFFPMPRPQRPRTRQGSAPSLLLAVVLLVPQLAVVQHPHDLGLRISWALVPLGLTATTGEAHPREFLSLLAVPCKRDALR